MTAIRKSVSIMILVLMLTACSEAEAGDADALWRLRTPHTGDNNAVIHILEEAGAKNYGGYTIELHTTTDPYGLTINYHNTNDKFNKKAAEKISALAVGLIDNLEYVEVKTPGKNYKYSIKKLNDDYNMKVKDMSKDKTKLEQFLQE